MLTLDIEKSKSLEQGINVHRLKPGTIVLVKTRNSLYKLIKEAGTHDVIAQGGKKLLEPTRVVFTGSTFGGSMIKIGWIGYRMNMEMYIATRRFKTSQVFAAKVIGHGWEYSMDWK